MAGPEERVSNEALQTEIKGLGDRIDEIKDLLITYEIRIRNLERAGDKTVPVVEKRIEMLEKLTDHHEKELEDLKALINTQAQSIEKLSHSVQSMDRLWKWGLGIFTTVITAIIILLLTGQAQVIFK